MRMAVSIDKVATIGPRADEFEAAGGAIERLGRLQDVRKPYGWGTFGTRMRTFFVWFDEARLARPRFSATCAQFVACLV
jgi:hypothetical protein